MMTALAGTREDVRSRRVQVESVLLGQRGARTMASGAGSAPHEAASFTVGSGMDGTLDGMEVRLAWVDTLVAGLRVKLTADGFDAHEFWDAESWCEVIVSWPGSGAAHCRFHAGPTEPGDGEEGARAAFFSVGVQGSGGLQRLDVTADAAGAERALADFRAFRRLVQAVQAESR